MQIRWSPGAAADLDCIVNYITEENEAAAQSVAQRIERGEFAARANYRWRRFRSW
jgi:plasmid stabilization system protein ParE